MNGMQQRLVASCFFFSLLWINACSVPNLEPAQCVAARDTVKRFYSLHFAKEISPTEATARANEQYLTERLHAELEDSPGQEDYFTRTEDFPKAFRVGSCDPASDAAATFQVVLLWRDNTRNDQSEVKVTTVRAVDRWLIDQVVK